MTSKTIARWIRLVLINAGIITTVFRARKNKAVSTSAAKIAEVSVNTITNVAGWSNALTFSKCYGKSLIVERDNSSENLGFNFIKSIHVAIIVL